MTPHRLVNYALDPNKDQDRFTIEDHAKMPEQPAGIIVVDKGAKHIGIWAADRGTIIHSKREGGGGKVVEEPFKLAVKSFPNGWRRVGPSVGAGAKAKKMEFSRKLDDIIEEARKEALAQKP